MMFLGYKSINYYVLSVNLTNHLSNHANYSDELKRNAYLLVFNGISSSTSSDHVDL